jgi:hypothetical protein
MPLPRHLPLAAAALLVSGCGYVGDPLPPSLQIPLPVEDLSARQEGSEIRFEFTPHLETTDKLVLRSLAGIDLRGGQGPAGAWDAERWAAAATVIPVAEPAKGETLSVRAAVTPWVGKEVAFGVRTRSPRGRLSGWSNFVVLTVVEPPARPGRLVAQASAAGVVLTWEPGSRQPGESWRVLRSEEDGAETEAGTAKEPRFLDAAARYGRLYTYRVQKVVPAGQHTAVSAISAHAAITPRDVFAPAVPQGLTALAGVGAVELSWEPNREPDLRGYRVFRAEGDGALSPLAELVSGPSFSDRTAKPGVRYLYAVSSLDTTGNESAKSPTIALVVP